MRLLLLHLATFFILFAGCVKSWGQVVLIDNAQGTSVQSVQMSKPGEAYAQAFSVGAEPHEIRSVFVRLTNTAGAAYEVRMAIWTDNGGSPGTKLEESDVIAELGTTPGAQRQKGWSLSDPPILNSNETYWLSVELVSGAMGWDFKGTTDIENGTGGVLIALNRISTDGGQTWPRDYPLGGIGMIRLDGARATFATVTSVLDSGQGTLREAIEEANAVAGPSLITFDPSLSGQTIRLDGTELTLDGDKIIIDASDLPDGIVISGDRGNDGHTPDDSRVFRIVFQTEAYLDSLIITGGRSPDGEALFGDRSGGGGISNEGTLYLYRSTIAGNTSGNGLDGDAGGVGTNGRAAPGGGGIANYRDAFIEQCTISNNLTGDGGDSTRNPGVGGGGGFGGGIFNQGTLTIQNSTVYGNVCGEGGDGIALNPGPAGGGGGIFSTGRLTVENCTIVENEAADARGNGFGGDGGGILWQGSLVDSLTLSNTIVAKNKAGTAGDGGGFAGRGPDVRRSFGTNVPMRSGVNLIGDNTGGDDVFAAGAPNPNGDLVGTGASPIDPDLGPFEDSGGPTLTLLPQSFSPCADPANGLTVAPFPFDQRGESRLIGARVDIGAVEAPNYAGIRALRSQLTRQIRNLNRKIRKLKRKGKKKQVRKIRKRVRNLQRTLRSL